MTLIVTLLHCPALTEIDAGKSLLNWGFAVDGKVRPVGTLVGGAAASGPVAGPFGPGGNRLRTARPATGRTVGGLRSLGARRGRVQRRGAARRGHRLLLQPPSAAAYVRALP